MKTILPPEQIIQAHQYLYYVLAKPVLSDYDYDMFCRANGCMGNGGSDSADDYTEADKALAEDILRYPAKYPCRYDLKKAMDYVAPDA